MIEIQIRDNGSINHPFYLCVYVDDFLVGEKSFKSRRAAELNQNKYMQQILVEMTRKLRKFSKIYEDLEEMAIDYPGKHEFRGTGHDDGE